ncbi:ABC transporter ATP-binding protein [Oceanibium sediminis]|uniref:ABC transporter ATP-binding protein n=1 Tax=Oceanibium sediminis TaxID=2026339 RepID=UPI000DD4465C|nr:sn-glycerol-3-phosphate ABC transporter ATP-binding protein UgpC [Oceanibium sediminis]
MTGTRITIDNVTKRYDRVEVIPGLSAQFEAGEFTVILGPSGCGKSTLLNMLAGLEEVTSGRLLFGAREVQNVPAKDRGCAMVFQNYALYPHMSVADNIGYSLKLAKVRKAERVERIAAVARIAGLEGYLDRRPSQLSGGQRQRVAIARAIVREPGVLLFDEPLSNLDAKLRNDMRIELSNLHKRIGATSVFVTHDQVEAMTLADRILILNEGQIEQFATPGEIYHRPRTTFVAEFIGAPAMNLLKARGEGGNLCLASGTPMTTVAHEGEVLAGVRPERIELSDAGLKAQVLYREDLGSHHILLVQLDSGEQMRLSTSQGGANADSSEVFLHIPPDAVHLFDPETQQRIN